MPEKFKFTVADGKHRNQDGTFSRKGEEVLLTREEAARFPNKFVAVTELAGAVDADEEAADADEEGN